MLYSWLWGSETSADDVAVVHRPDYVERLLEGDGS
jgi:hypothetical protein